MNHSIVFFCFTSLSFCQSSHILSYLAPLRIAAFWSHILLSSFCSLLSSSDCIAELSRYTADSLVNDFSSQNLYPISLNICTSNSGVSTCFLLSTMFLSVGDIYCSTIVDVLALGLGVNVVLMAFTVL